MRSLRRIPLAICLLGAAILACSPRGQQLPDLRRRTEPVRTILSAKQKTYAIRTAQEDPGRDKPEDPGEGRPAPADDTFRGSVRSAAKLGIADVRVEPFNDLKDLIASLPSEDDMRNHKPPITTDRDSDRVAVEKRNVRVRCFLYAASKRKDNDIHLIVGRAPGTELEQYLMTELSGLPPTDHPSYEKLKAVRDRFKSFLGSNLPGSNYDFYDPPIPIVVEGSLFFDVAHLTGSRPGPSSLQRRMPVIWEIHPITDLVFEP